MKGRRTIFTGRRAIFRASLLLLALGCAPRVWARGIGQDTGQGGAQGGGPVARQTPAPVPNESQEERSQPPRQNQLELMRALNLTPEQRARIAEIRRETERQSRQITLRLRRARRALEQAIYAEQADESAIRPRVKEVADAEAARVEMRADAELKVRRALTPEQFAAFRELRRQAQLTRARQNALDGADAPRQQGARTPRTPARAADAPARDGAGPAPVPTLFPRRPRRNPPNRRPPARP